MRTKVIIISPIDDIHALAIKKRIEDIYKGEVHCMLFDTATFPIASEIEWVSESGLFNAILHVSGALASSIGPKVAEVIEAMDSKEKYRIEIGSDSAIWNRRYRKPMLRSGIEIDEFYEYSYSAQLSNLISILNGKGCFNSWFEEEQADLKPYQLKTAAETGLMIPETLISSRGKEIQSFFYKMKEKGEEVIYKEISNGSIGMPTRILHEPGLERLKEKEIAPMIFQQRIKGKDLRVAVIGETVFACDWKSERGDENIDIRMQEATKMFASAFPGEQIENLLKFHKRLGLDFGIYDFKTDTENRLYFLEINPSGQWLDMEIDGKQPISEAIARYLTGEGWDQNCREPLFVREDLEKIAYTATLPLEWKQIALEHV